MVEQEFDVCTTHLCYLKPLMEALLVELKSNERKAEREWQYVNAARVWLDIKLSGLASVEKIDGRIEELGQLFLSAKTCLKAALEIRAMRTQ